MIGQRSKKGILIPVIDLQRDPVAGRSSRLVGSSANDPTSNISICDVA
jgi:hypothetical protein